MQIDMAGKVALVTGASRGIGVAIAREFRAAGARLALAARDGDALAALAEELGGPEHVLCAPTDVADPAAVERMIAQTENAFGRLDFAINNAAGGGHR